MTINLALLRGVPLMARLRDNDLGQLAKTLVGVSFGPGEVIVEEAEAGDALYIVVDGVVEVSLSGGKGERFVVSRLRAGDYFGEMSLIDGSARSATVRSVDSASLLRLGREDFMGAATLHPSIAFAVMREFSRRLRTADAHIGLLTRHSVNPPSMGRDEDPAALQEEQKLLLLRDFLQAGVPFHGAVGLIFEELEPGLAICRVPWRASLVGDPFMGTLHSGVISTLVEAAGSAAVFAMLDAAEDRVSTVDLHVDFVRPGWEDDLVCEARVVRMGNRVAQTQVRVWSAAIPTDAAGLANPIATARAVYNVERGPSPSPPADPDADLIDL